ncbi:ferrichrome ABC transporter substrate-binding protein [Thalassospira tepidiphila]|uniref:ABC transporter substrate-binding protein n=1 Tax=Thalassospira tepidiphila TaxID=393657 RepID=UPI0029253A36|nr:ferrichrome ABC transporter substrate-binding protein [Thalassospira tepidiphila]
MNILRALVCPVLLCAALIGAHASTAIADPIEIEHERGTLRLNTPATRVATINWAFTESVIALGLDPVAIADPQDYVDWVAKPDLPDSFVDLGQRSSPNLEALRAAKPDLIISVPDLGMSYEKLAEIAPVLELRLFDGNRPAFETAREVFGKIAKATGLEEEAKAYLADIDQELVKYGDRIKTAIGPDQTINVVFFFDESNVGIFADISLPGSVMTAMGVPVAYDGEVNKWGFGRGGLEILAPYARETLVYTNPVPEIVLDKLLNSPIWKVMDFTRNNRVYELPVVWAYGGVPSGLRFAKLLTETIENGPQQ